MISQKGSEEKKHWLLTQLRGTGILQHSESKVQVPPSVTHPSVVVVVALVAVVEVCAVEVAPVVIVVEVCAVEVVPVVVVVLVVVVVVLYCKQYQQLKQQVSEESYLC